MRSILLSLLLFTVCSVSLIAQSYDEYIFEANRLYQLKEYKASSKQWNKAFSIHKGYASDYYNAACTNALAENTEEAYRNLELAVKTGWDDIDWMNKDSDLSSLRSSIKWELFIKEIPRLQEQYLSLLNLKIKNELESLRIQDQTIRLLLPDAEKRFGRSSKAYRWYRNTLMPRNDSIVLTKIINIIDTNGWLGISEVGELANQTLWLVIQHAPLKIQEKYIPYLKESVDKGESKARYLAFLQDRILMRKKEKQIYGTQSLWNKEKKKNVIWPVEDAKNVNQRRKEVGLETIEDYAKNNRFLYLKEN